MATTEMARELTEAARDALLKNPDVIAVQISVCVKSDTSPTDTNYYSTWGGWGLMLEALARRVFEDIRKGNGG